MGRRKAKPCVLCEEQMTDSASQVCSYCKQDWKKGREFRALVQDGDDAHEIVHTVDNWYLYHFAGTASFEIKINGKGKLQRALLDLAEAVDVDVHNWHSGYKVAPIESRDDLIGWTEKISTRDFHRRAYVVRRGSGELLRTTYRQIVDLLADAYEEGARKGGSMLRGLATGERTVDDYNRWFAEVSEKKQG